MSDAAAGALARRATLVRRRLEQIRRMGPLAACRLVGSRALRAINAIGTRTLDRVRPTATSVRRVGSEATRLINAPVSAPGELPEAQIIDRIVRGDFQLLGNEWTTLVRDGDPELPWSQRRRVRWWRQLFAGYRSAAHVASALAWNLDWRSGHRWPSAAWHREIPYGDSPGIDIKLPWELSRLQHLPWLALRARQFDATDATSEIDAPSDFDLAAGAQLVDFIAANPPRFGVNWVCAMDVGIRIANWAIAWQLRGNAGFAVDVPLRHQLMASAVDHIEHIIATLEWSPTLRSNHYLANVAGVLIAAAWLPASPRSDRWLRLAARELLFEIDGQFDAHGANFEASTSYHRLSSEMAIYGVAVLLAADRVRGDALRGGSATERLHPPPLPPELRFTNDVDGTSRLDIPAHTIRRLAGMARFTREIMRPNGQIPQIGDNDSGRFVKIAPAWSRRDGAPFEDLLDHRHLIDAVRGLFDLPLGDDAPMESRIVRAFVGDRALPWPDDLPRPDDPPSRFIAYPEFGLRIWRTRRFHLLLRCGPVGQNGNGGHAHSDQCAIDLAIDGHPFIVDPGSGIYTPDHATRNAFRAASAHATLSVEGVEPNFWYPGRAGLFHMEDRSHGTVSDESDRGATATHTGFGEPFVRRLAIDDATVAFDDEIPKSILTKASLMLPLHPTVTATRVDGGVMLTGPNGTTAIVAIAGATFDVAPARYSAGYGQIEPSTTIRIRPTTENVRWSVRARPTQ